MEENLTGLLPSDSGDDGVKRRKGVLAAKIREAFETVTGFDENFLKSREEIFWEKVDQVIKRRSIQIKKAHCKRILWKMKVAENYVPDAKIDDRELRIALEISSAKRQFSTLLRENIAAWKKKRARDIRCALIISMGRNNDSIDYEDRFKKRMNQVDGEIAWEVNYLAGPHAYDSIRWLWSDADKIDIASLRGRTLEDICFD